MTKIPARRALMVAGMQNTKTHEDYIIEVLTDFLPHIFNEFFDGAVRTLLQPYAQKGKKIPRIFPVWKSVNKHSGESSELKPEQVPLKPGVYGKYVRTNDGKLVVINLKGV